MKGGLDRIGQQMMGGVGGGELHLKKIIIKQHTVRQKHKLVLMINQLSTGVWT